MSKYSKGYFATLKGKTVTFVVVSSFGDIKVQFVNSFADYKIEITNTPILIFYDIINLEEIIMSKSIVIYFSRADENYSVGYIEKGNTEVIAEYIRDFTGADMFKVERKIPYAKDYNTCIRESQDEQRKNARPELVKELANIDEYDTVYIGAPIYWGTMPNPMFTQLEKLNWQDKVVKPFTTHEGSGLGNVVSDLKKLCKGAIVKDGLAIYGHNVYNSKDKVKNWL